MKIRKKAFFLIGIAVMSLAACGIRADRSVYSGEIVVPEVSSEDFLVSSLEYLLLDNTDDTDDGTESDGQQDAEGANVNQDNQAVIYYGDGGSLALQDGSVEVESLTPEALIEALARHNIVSLDTKVLSCNQTHENGTAVLYLDMSKAFGEYLRTMSKEAECIILAAVANTFLENYSADVIYITVEGETLVTSHAEYTDAIARCTPEELLRALEAPDSENNKTSVMNDSADEVYCKLPLAAEKK